jgi:3-methyl-2-oxobutanoate hydroxymethyltransferase
LVNSGYNSKMASSLTKKVTLADLRSARQAGPKMAMLTCYDYTTARLMQEAGVPALLVGDSAAQVILGHDSTLPVPLDFMIEITAAVRRGAPLALVIADMPFGSYHASVAQAVRNVCRMVKATGCDAVKLEVGSMHFNLVRTLSQAGVAVVAHLGLKPQSVGLLGGYKFQGRTADEADAILASALQMEQAGAAAILLEAVPPEVANAVVEQSSVPIIGCGAGPGCHACVIVTHDGLGLTPYQPRFVPSLAELAEPLRKSFADYVDRVVGGKYPAIEHDYVMPPEEKAKFVERLEDLPF